MRLFIAAPVPKDIEKEALKIALQIKKESPIVKANWVRSGHMHLTLVFLGDTPESKIDAIIKASARALAHQNTLDAALSGLGTFPEDNSARVLWLGLDKGADTLNQLASQLAEALEDAGLTPNRKPFHAHLTLARIKAVKPPANSLQQWLNAFKFNHNPQGSWRIDQIQLIKSQLTPEGPNYQIMERFKLNA